MESMNKATSTACTRPPSTSEPEDPSKGISSPQIAKPMNSVDIRNAQGTVNKPSFTETPSENGYAGQANVESKSDRHPAPCSPSNRDSLFSFVPNIKPQVNSSAREENEESFSSPASEVTGESDEEHLEDMVWICRNCADMQRQDMCRRCLLDREIARYDGTPGTRDQLQNLIDSSRGGVMGTSGRWYPEKRPSGVSYCFDDSTLLHDEEPDEDEEDHSTDEFYKLRRDRLPDLHVERPDRVKCIDTHLKTLGLKSSMSVVRSRPASKDQICSIHSEELYDRLRWTSGRSGMRISSDTYLNEHSFDSATSAVGSVIAVTEQVVLGKALNGVAVVRPPGHHAEPGKSMGFCLFNSVAIAAKMATQIWGVGRIVILDWDIHHGNGTEKAFYDDDSVLVVSLHRNDDGFFPGTGSTDRIGAAAGRGFNLNIAWPKGDMTDSDYLAAFGLLILPVLNQFKPDLIMVSAGFDAAQGDPLGGCHVSPAGFSQMTSMLSCVAGGNLVVALEGGYSLSAMANSAEAVTRVLLGEPPVRLPAVRNVSFAAMNTIRKTSFMHLPHWSCLAAFAQVMKPLLLTNQETNEATLAGSKRSYPSTDGSSDEEDDGTFGSDVHGSVEGVGHMDDSQDSDDDGSSERAW